MKEQASPAPSPWTHGPLPAGVVVGPETRITAEYAFKRYRARPPGELVIGTNGTMDGVHFAVGESGRLVIGNFCYFTNAVLLCELEIRIGNYVMAGWNTTIADSDFHPIAPADRILDAIACSPLGRNRPRPTIAMKPVVIGDDVWIGPNSTILKGVHIGDGAFIEAGSLVTHDIPAGARVLGNPAQVLPPL